MSYPSYLDGLNDRQREAAMHTDGPLLIIAGAGAGKTKTITHRIAYLIEKGIPPYQILAVTFTNKAAGEMRERVRALVPAGRGMPLIATFHSLGVRILREYWKEAHVPRGFTIWDREDSLRALRRISEAHDESLPARAILAKISRAKGDGMSAEDFELEAKNFREKAIARAWHEYEKALAEEDALDFDDLLLRTLSLLQQSAGTRENLQDRWRFITIDEYQDTNRAQYDIARLLSGDRKNICVVGDIDQNIYSWRGADIEHLLQFEENFPGTKVVTLEQNYRSTRTILSAANAVIEKNRRRKPKTLYTDKETGEPIAIYEARNDMDEAWFIAAKAQELLEESPPAGRQRTRPGEIAVLYRENFQSRAIEEALLHHGLPYRVLGTRFFERKEVKDVLSYLRAAMNTKSRTDLQRIVGVPSRGIGKVTMEKMVAGRDAELPAAARGKIQKFRDSLGKIKKALETLPTSEAVRYALEESGMEAMFSAEGGSASGGKKSDEDRERLANIQELLNFSTKFDFVPPPGGIEQLLEEAALQSEQDQLEDRQDAISLMTVHASKGLEFDTVFITGLEQGLFPSIREDDGTRDSEEERRLFYVALTRAKERLFLSYANERMRYGSRDLQVPSEFLDDIDQRLVEWASRAGAINHEEKTIR